MSQCLSKKADQCVRALPGAVVALVTWLTKNCDVQDFVWDSHEMLRGQQVIRRSCMYKWRQLNCALTILPYPGFMYICAC